MTSLDTYASGDAVRGSRKSFYERARAALDGLSVMMITVIDWQYQSRERRQLLGLSDHALKDFGASRADAEREGSKPFWRR